MNPIHQRLAAALQAGHIQPGEVAHVEVAHGPGCAIWNTDGCTCQPALTVLRDEEVLSLGADGSLIERRRKS